MVYITFRFYFVISRDLIKRLWLYVRWLNTLNRIVLFLSSKSIALRRLLSIAANTIQDGCFFVFVESFWLFRHCWPNNQYNQSLPQADFCVKQTANTKRMESYCTSTVLFAVNENLFTAIRAEASLPTQFVNNIE